MSFRPIVTSCILVIGSSLFPPFALLLPAYLPCFIFHLCSFVNTYIIFSPMVSFLFYLLAYVYCAFFKAWRPLCTSHLHDFHATSFILSALIISIHHRHPRLRHVPVQIHYMLERVCPFRSCFLLLALLLYGSFHASHPSFTRTYQHTYPPTKAAVRRQ